ncbi:transcriptional regulator, TetR family [Mesonia phycicola]|uniref:Transcriptional regulator, TetR family n=1 Tax=Mesonia phycicola TaxID=579105 RepID=A0A1M6H0L0_9FLAO|nr:TetR/AcrR family transcriptional regulator [Mesonia phycicola]SHJ15654.1 transcriptional regulator, TetR family [Mesonia phycicola]
MPRLKKYNEEEVIEKAMNLFWLNGYKTTSMQMLEKEMGINKFSIYSSFGNKDGIFLESIKCYKKKLGKLIQKLQKSESGIEGIKEYFYEFIEFSKDNDIAKGCFVTNAANEIGQEASTQIAQALTSFTQNVKESFSIALKHDKSKQQNIIEQQADYLLIAMFGLSSATKMFNKEQLDNYIENTFKNL